MSKEIVKKEVRFSWHIPKNDQRDDLHYIREDHTLEDGSVVPHTYLTKDFKRPVYVSKTNFRNYKEKREFEEKDKLNMQLTTQSDINRTVANMLGQPHLASQPDKVKASPYVYGYDITSTSFIKLMSLNKNNFIQSTCTVAVFDIETDIDDNHIKMATVTYGNKSYTSILSSYLKNISDVDYRVKKAIEKYLPKYVNLEFTIKEHGNEVDLLKDIFRVCNEWAPVFLAVWNMDFDIPRCLDRLKYFNVNPIDVICDKTVPRWARVCRYKQGLKKKITASGVVKPINPSLQWHTLICTSKFYVIDAMCVYRQLRMAKAEKTSYSLDYILQDELGSRKLKFEEANEYKGAKWHIFMQENYPIEYIVYNIYDCLGVLELDAKNKDLSNVLLSFAGISDLQKFNSQVRKVSDAVFLFGLEKNLIIGTVGKNKEEVKAEEDEIDDSLLGESEDEEIYKTLDLKGWIQLLPQNLLLHDGLKCLEEYPDVVTNIRGVTVDLDCSSAYPSCTLSANVSKATCVNELISIEGITEEVFRTQNLGVCLGGANTIEYATVMFGMPSLDEIDKYIDQLV